MARRREPILDAPELGGRAFCSAHADAADRWLGSIFDDAVRAAEGGVDPDRVALVAVGGFGRGALCPWSDLDLLLLHDGVEVEALAEALWYPIWDRGLKLGHTVATVEECGHLVEQELDRATALLDTRRIRGGVELVAELDRLVGDTWARRAPAFLERLATSSTRRRAKFGHVAFHLEPDLKEGAGGLRDVHTLRWAERAAPGFTSSLPDDLDDAVGVLLDARVALHRAAGRPTDVLTLELQDEVAEALRVDADRLMADVAAAARRISWVADRTWRSWHQRAHPSESQPLDRGLEIRAGDVAVRDGLETDWRPTILDLAATAARFETRIHPDTLDALGPGDVPEPPWPTDQRERFVELLSQGHHAIPIIEDLDQSGIMEQLLPEWSNVRSKPQRNSLHRFTVDRHLLEAAAIAAELTDDVARPDLLVIGALLHDIGKGFPGDHTEVGMARIPAIAARMGFDEVDASVLVDLCRDHLLLPDVATRRDLSEPGTILSVAAIVADADYLDLLAALTEADSRATGPATWGSWKAALLGELRSRTHDVLAGREPTVEDSEGFPSADLQERMRSADRWIETVRETITVIDRDRPGTFSAVAGVLTVAGLDVLDARAFSDDSGAALSQFTVLPPASGEIDWPQIELLLRRALDGRLALSARVARRARTYHAYRRRLAAVPPEFELRVDNETSARSTILEFHAEDTIGLLFQLTRALAELRLDIRSARVQTLGPLAVDTFYVRTEAGGKLDDELLAEVELAASEMTETA